MTGGSVHLIDWSLVAVPVSVSPQSIFHTSSGVTFLFIFFWRVVSLDKLVLLRVYVMTQVTRHVLSTPNGNQHRFNATQNNSGWYVEPVIPVSTFTLSMERYSLYLMYYI